MKIIIPLPKRNSGTRLPSVLPAPVHTHIVVANPYAMIAEKRAEQGAKAWTALHSYRGSDPEKFLNEVFVPMIPQGSCTCTDGYRKIVAEYPPDFSSPAAFFAWGVMLHNLVNEKINLQRGESRRIYSIEDAYREWWPEMLAA